MHTAVKTVMIGAVLVLIASKQIEYKSLFGRKSGGLLYQCCVWADDGA